MKRILVLIVIGLISISGTYAQGGWNIGVIPRDSIGKQHVGWKVLPDFTANSELKDHIKRKTNNSNPNPMYFIRSRDSSTVTIDDKEYLAWEIRRIGVDYGYMKNQLVKLKPSKGRTFEVYEMTLTSYSADSIELEFRDRKHRRKFWVELEKLDGLIYKR